MTSEQISVRNWMIACQQECPKIPTMPTLDIRKLRLNLIFEELLELGRSFGYTLTEEGWELATCYPPDLQESADATADLKVVVFGTDCALGLDGEPFFQEVMQSNYTKLVTGPDG